MPSSAISISCSVVSGAFVVVEVELLLDVSQMIRGIHVATLSDHLKNVCCTVIVVVVVSVPSVHHEGGFGLSLSLSKLHTFSRMTVWK